MECETSTQPTLHYEMKLTVIRPGALWTVMWLIQVCIMYRKDNTEKGTQCNVPQECIIYWNDQTKMNSCAWRKDIHVLWEHVAQWIGRWTQDQKVWGRFPGVAMCRSVGKLHIPHCLSPPRLNGYLVHRSKVGSIVAGCIGAHLARGKVQSVEHALSWSLDSKQLPLPLLISFQMQGLFKWPIIVFLCTQLTV